MSEIQALQKDCIDFMSGAIYIRRMYCKATKQMMDNTKGGRMRVLGMSKNLQNSLAKHVKSHPFSLVFCDESGNILSQDYIRYHFLEDQKKAGVRPINFHALRHTYASHYVMKGGALYDLQGLLGHSSTEVTKRYAHLAPDHLMAKANVVTFAAAI